MLISLSPTILDAGPLFRSRCEGSKSAVQKQKILTDKPASLSKLLHNRTSTDSVACLARWYKNRWLSDAEKDKKDSFLLEMGSLINYGLQLSETLESLSERANELHTSFNALAPEEQEHEYPRIQEELQAIYAEQQRIYALLDSAPEENQEELPISKEMQQTGTERAPMGLIQQVQALDQKLSAVEQEEERYTTSLMEYFVSIPRTETVICTIASVVTAVGIGLQLPFFICCVSIVVSIAMAVVRFVNFISSDKRHAKNNDVLILRREVIGSYMNILNDMISSIFQIKQDTSDIKKDMQTAGVALNQVNANVRDLKTTIRGLEQKIDSAPASISHNDNRQHITYVQQINFVDPKYLLPAEQQLLLAQGSAARPAITFYQESQKSAEILLDHQQRQRQGSAGSLPDLTFYGSSLESSSSEGESRSLAFYRAKARARIEPTIFEGHNIEELLSSDSESDEVLTVEEKGQLKKARRAKKNAELRALFEEQQKRLNDLEAENAAMKQKQAAIQALIA